MLCDCTLFWEVYCSRLKGRSLYIPVLGIYLIKINLSLCSDDVFRYPLRDFESFYKPSMYMEIVARLMAIDGQRKHIHID